MWVLWLVACGAGDERLVSVPSKPAVELGGEQQADAPIVWTELTDLFPEGGAALPTMLAELEPGLSGSRAREIVDAAHRPGVRIIGRQVAGHMVLQTELERFPTVGVTLILDPEGEKLQQVDLSLPLDQALVLLGARWGDPSATAFDDEGKAVHTWNGGPWTVELHDAGEKAVVKFR